MAYLQSRWTPGTDKLVMIMVKHRRRKIVPAIAKNLLAMINLCLWKRMTRSQIVRSVIPVISVISKAHGMWGTLSRMISGRGGYLFMSGTLSCTTVITTSVSQDTEVAKFDLGEGRRGLQEAHSGMSIFLTSPGSLWGGSLPLLESSELDKSKVSDHFTGEASRVAAMV